VPKDAPRIRYPHAVHQNARGWQATGVSSVFVENRTDTNYPQTPIIRMPLDPERVQAVFLEAANYYDPVERAAILDREECMGDPELRKRIEALLKAHDRSDEDRSFFLRCYWNP
jgi:hypothetical protein